jgi:hypothetical protein
MLSLARASTSPVLALLLLAASSGLAAEPETPVAAARLEVRSSPNCASKADLVERVLARSPRVRFVESEGALTIRARFETAPAGKVTGELVMAGAGAKSTTRRVVARSCDEASDAVALIIAVTLDPSSEVQAGAGTGRETPSESPGDAPAETPGSPQDSPATKPAEEVKTKPTPVPPPPKENAPNDKDNEEDTPEDEEPIEPWHPTPSIPAEARFGAQLAAQSLFGPAPAPMFGIAIYATAAADRPVPLSPALVVGLMRAWRTGVEEEGGTASFVLDAVSLDACLFRLTFPALETRLCAAALGGRMKSEGAETINPVSEVARPFWVIGGSAVFTARIGAIWEPLARLSVGGNLVKDSYTFEPNRFYEVPDITVAASIGFGVRSP